MRSGLIMAKAWPRMSNATKKDLTPDVPKKDLTPDVLTPDARMCYPPDVQVEITSVRSGVLMLLFWSSTSMLGLPEAYRAMHFNDYDTTCQVIRLPYPASVTGMKIRPVRAVPDRASQVGNYLLATCQILGSGCADHSLPFSLPYSS